VGDREREARDDARKTILSRRARFIAATLAGVGVGVSACGDSSRPATKVASSSPVSTIEAMDAGAAPETSPSELDSDGDGVPDKDDVCPKEKGYSATAGTGLVSPLGVGCPCLTIISNPKIEIIHVVHFDLGQSKLRADELVRLDEIVHVLEVNPVLRLDVRGHADTKEKAPVADARAKSVIAYLVSKGIAASRLTAKELGSSELVDKSGNPEAGAKNRRVDFRTYDGAP
jgi:outer membrane protein OmpA-like peptidoglycan-associated protein